MASSEYHAPARLLVDGTMAVSAVDRSRRSRSRPSLRGIRITLSAAVLGLALTACGGGGGAGGGPESASEAISFLLSVTNSGAGNGIVTSSPSGINCGSTCSSSYNSGTSVTLTAVADPGSTFTGWSGESCAGKGLCTLVMAQTRAVTATFDTADTTLPPPPPTPGEWSPPIGIPEPSFGIRETNMMYELQSGEACSDTPNKCFDFGNGLEPYKDAGAGPYTHYVDNTSPLATDTDNLFGTANKPRINFPTLSTLPAGSVVEVHGGPYSKHTYISSNNATEDKPIFFRGASYDERPIIQNVTFMIRGHYIILENFHFIDIAVDIRPWFSYEAVDHVAMRHNETTGERTAGSTGSYVDGNPTHDVVFYDNYVHLSTVGRMKAAPDTFEEDNEGFVAVQNSSNVWIVDNDLSGMGGDSAGGGHAAKYTAHNYYIGRNRLHNTGENAIDLKEIENVVVSQNVMFDFTGPSAGSDGTAVVIHYGPTYSPINAWLIFNDISQSPAKAIQVGGDSVPDVFLIGNVIHNLHDGAGGARAFETWGSRKINLVGNTIYDVDNAWKASGTASSGGLLVAENNIVSNVSPGGYILTLDDSTYAAAAVIKNNLFYIPGVDLETGGVLNPSYFSKVPATQANNLFDLNPMLANPASNDFSLKVGSPAIGSADTSLAASLASQFQSLFGVGVMQDFLGVTRPQGPAWDIGAFENCSADCGVPIPPPAALTYPLDKPNTFLKSSDWRYLVPSETNGMKKLITAGGGDASGNDHVASAATPPGAAGSALVAHIPSAHTGTITVDMTAMNIALVRARWYDPASSVSPYTDIGTFSNTGTQVFTPPTGAPGDGSHDWFLVLD